MSRRRETADYRTLFLTPTPLIDLRAPAEFARGAFPTAASLPLMTDRERAAVGTCYKERGQQAAIELGHRLVAGEVRERRLAAWLEFARLHPDGCLYCWRGGLRSSTVQAWLAECGVDYPRVTGGYKAMRRYLLQELDRTLLRAPFTLVGGRTGTGKTRVIERLSSALDLEGLARHRGSSFGQLPDPQPSQIDFENALAIELSRLLARGVAAVFVEDEGRLIGRLHLPQMLRERMRQAPLVLVEEPLPARVDVVLEDYIDELGREYRERFGEDGAALHARKMQDDLARIARRLGGERYQRVHAMMAGAFEQQARDGDTAGHREWIAFLLEYYYDPMYDYQLRQREGPVLFRGDRSAVVSWAAAGSHDAVSG